MPTFIIIWTHSADPVLGTFLASFPTPGDEIVTLQGTINDKNREN